MSSPSDSLRFRLRELDVTLEASPADQLETLAHLVSHADDDFPSTTSVRMRLTRTGERGREVSEQGGPTRRVCCDEIALGHILHRLTTKLIALYPDAACVHAGAASIDGRLALFTGDRGAGKTTLLLQLLRDGAAFHCDEMVVAHDGVATTLPRRLHVKAGTLDCLPEVAEACQDKPLLKIGRGPRFYPVDPVELGYAWRSASARPAAIFHLEPGFDGPPRIEPMTQIQMVKRLMCQVLNGQRGSGLQAADICSIVRGVPCYALRVGGLAETSALVWRTVAAPG